MGVFWQAALLLSTTTDHRPIEPVNLRTRCWDRDQTERAYPSALARYGIQRVKTGRQIGTRLNVRDVSSQHCRLAKGLVMHRLDHFDPEQDGWLEKHDESIYETRGGPFVAPGGATHPMGDRSQQLSGSLINKNSNGLNRTASDSRRRVRLDPILPGPAGGATAKSCLPNSATLL